MSNSDEIWKETCMVKTPRKLEADIGYHPDVQDSPRTSQILKERLEFFKDLQSPRNQPRSMGGLNNHLPRAVPHSIRTRSSKEGGETARLDVSEQLQAKLKPKEHSSTMSAQSSQNMDGSSEYHEDKTPSSNDQVTSPTSSCQASDPWAEDHNASCNPCNELQYHEQEKHVVPAEIAQMSSPSERGAAPSNGKPHQPRYEDFCEIEELESLDDDSVGKILPSSAISDVPKSRSILSGWLWTGNRVACFPSFSGGSWIRHFFVVVPGMLVCYDDESCCNDIASSRFRIDLNAGICVKKSRKNANVIKVVIGRRTVLLKTESSKDTSLWQEALMEAFSLSVDQLDYTLTLRAEAGVRSHGQEFLSLPREKPRQIWTPTSKAIDLELRLNGSD
eukprot:753595-Hanusia_phi.AAC.1